MAKYDKQRRSTAAKQGWNTRRGNAAKFSQPDYGIAPITSQSAQDNIEIGAELPVERLALFGNIAGWEDDVKAIDEDGYRVIHSCFPVVESVSKLAVRTSKLNWTVVGEGARADAIREIILQAKGWADMIEWLTWAEVDGVRFMQIKSAPALAGGEPWIVPDFWMGGRKKAKAGGEIQWDGGKRLVLKQHTTSVQNQEAKTLPTWQFIIHRPGAGSNPEGDLNKGVAMYRIAYLWNEALKNTDAHMQLFGIPIRVFKGKMDSVRPTDLASTLTANANKLKQLRTNKDVSLTDEQMLELIEPKGQGFKDLIEYAMYLEGLIDQMFLGNTLTSKTNEATRTGNTETHKSEEDEMAFINGVRIAETLNRHLIPWIIRKNDLPELADGESEVYLWPQDPSEDDEQDIDIEDETPQDVVDGQPSEPAGPDDESATEPDGVNPDTVAVDDTEEDDDN